MQIQIKQEKIVTNVILDGTILKENLKNLGHDEAWLNKELNKQGKFKISDIFLATLDYEDNLSVYVKINKSNSHDMFE